MEEIKVNKAPKDVLDLIDHYMNLKIQDKLVVCPYYRNVKRVRAELRSLVGKGTPSEIEEEVKIYSKLRGFDLKGKTSDEIRKFMQSQGIGIDCSGFVSHVLDEWLKTVYDTKISSKIIFPKTTILRTFVRHLRPIENISANLLTSELNSEKVLLKDIRPGDLLRLKGLRRGHHVAIIIGVERDPRDKIKSFTYAESSENYGDSNGVRIGKVNITDEEKDLRFQLWDDKKDGEICWTLKQLEKDYDDNGIRRPKFIT